MQRSRLRLILLCGTLAMLGTNDLFGASTVGTSTSAQAIAYSSRWYVHYASGYYWVGFHNGTTPVLYSSPNGGAWTAQGSIFGGAPDNDLTWGLTFEANKVHAVRMYFSGGYFSRYRQGALNTDGTVTWGTEVTIGAVNDYTSENQMGAGHTDSAGLPWVYGGLDHKVSRNSLTTGQGRG